MDFIIILFYNYIDSFGVGNLEESICKIIFTNET